MPAKKTELVVSLVSVSAHVYPKDTLFFRHAVGSAEREGKTWELSTNVSDMAPIIKLPDGRWVVLPWQTLIDAANEAGDKVEV